MAQLWARGVPVRAAIKLAVFGAGFVVSVKMMLGGYLALQAEAEPGMVEVVGFYGSIGLALLFGWVTLFLSPGQCRYASGRNPALPPPAPLLILAPFP